MVLQSHHQKLREEVSDYKQKVGIRFLSRQLPMRYPCLAHHPAGPAAHHALGWAWWRQLLGPTGPAAFLLQGCMGECTAHSAARHACLAALLGPDEASASV